MKRQFHAPARWVSLPLLITLALATSAGAANATVTNLSQIGFGALAVDNAAQHVFVSGPLDNIITEVGFSGTVVTNIGDLPGADGMTISGRTLYVSESTAGAIVALNLDNPTATPQTIATGLNDPTSLVETGGLLWVSVGGNQWAGIDSVNPTTGLVTPLAPPQAGGFYDPDLAVSPGDPSTLFVAEDGQSPGTIYRYNVAGATASLAASSSVLNENNIEGLVVSPDGTRVIPAAAAYYAFQEFNATTLATDGIIYPGSAYPVAVAVSASGVLATALEGYDTPSLAVYQLGSVTPMYTASGPAGNNGFEAPYPHGLALSADGSELFGVSNGTGVSNNATLQTVSLVPAPTITALAPASGSQLGGTAVTVTGTGFVAGQTTVSFGTSPATSVTVNSPTSLTATSPIGTGSVDVTAVNTGVTSATSAADLFTYTPVALKGWTLSGTLKLGGAGVVTLPSGASFTGSADLRGETFSGAFSIPAFSFTPKGSPFTVTLQLTQAAALSGSLIDVVPTGFDLSAGAQLGIAVKSVKLGPLSVASGCTTSTPVLLSLTEDASYSALASGLTFSGSTTIPSFTGSGLCSWVSQQLAGSGNPFTLSIKPAT